MMVSLSPQCPIFCAGKTVTGALVRSPNWPIRSLIGLQHRLFVFPLPEDTDATSISIIRIEDLLRLTTAYLNRIAETIRFHGI